MMDEIRNCLHKKYVRTFEHNFVADKEKIRRHIPLRAYTNGKFFNMRYEQSVHGQPEDIVHIKEIKKYINGSADKLEK